MVARISIRPHEKVICGQTFSSTVPAYFIPGVSNESVVTHVSQVPPFNVRVVEVIPLSQLNLDPWEVSQFFPEGLPMEGGSSSSTHANLDAHTSLPVPHEYHFSWKEWIETWYPDNGETKSVIED